MPPFNRPINKGLVEQAPARIVEATRYRADMNLVEAAAAAEQPTGDAEMIPERKPTNYLLIGAAVIALLFLFSKKR